MDNLLEKLKEIINKSSRFSIILKNKDHPLHDYVMSGYGRSISERCYNLINPDLRINKCLHCGVDHEKFISFSIGYQRYCSITCSRNSIDSRSIRRENSLKKYGVEEPISSSKVRSKIIETMVDRYGVSNFFSSTEFIQDNDYRKGQTSSVKAKIKNYDWKKKQEQIYDEVGSKLVSDQEYKGSYHIYRWVHNCGFQYDSPIVGGHIPSCKICAPQSQHQKEIEEFIQSLGKKTVQDKKSIIPPYGIDIYIPEDKLAIEYNGNYWHSEKFGRDGNYHLDKVRSCQERGIRLIHIFEDEWIYKKEIVKSKISYMLGKSIAISARRCKLIDISYQDSNKFLEENHVQGAAISSIRIGLERDGVLVALMTFGKPRFNSNYDLELIRYCTLKNHRVIGGASKIFKHFRSKFPGAKIISYASRNWSVGNLYETIGFKFSHETSPSYYYINQQGIRLNRLTLQKHKLKTVLEDKFDPTLTAKQNIERAGFLKIWDTGNLVYIN